MAVPSVWPVLLNGVNSAMLRSTESYGDSQQQQPIIKQRKSSGASIVSELAYSDVDRTWSVLDARVCLPAILNDPRHNRHHRPQNEPTPPIPPTQLPQADERVFDVYRAKLKSRRVAQTTSVNPFTEQHQQQRQSQETEKVPSRFYAPAYESVDELKTALGTGVLDHDVKLKTWLDITEVELGRRLSNRASSFLAAVAAQDELKNIIARSLGQSRQLRQNVRQIGHEMTRSPLASIRHKVRIERLKGTVKLLRDIEMVRSSPAHIRLLLETFDFVRANEVIKAIRHALTHELKGIACLRGLSFEMDEQEKQLHTMLVDEARNIFEMLITNGDMNVEQFEMIQQSIVDANRTADTIQLIHDVIEADANRILSLTRDEEDLAAKLSADTSRLKELLSAVCRGVVRPEFDILKKSSVEVIQHRLLRNLADIAFSKSKDFPALLPILYEFNAHCCAITGVNGPILQHVKGETQKYLNRFHEERRQRLTLLLDNEEWRSAEVPKELQLAVDDVLMQGQGCDNSVKPRPKRVELIANYVDVSGEKFAVIGASLLLIRMIQDYLRCLVKLPETSLLHKLADLLSLFNSRCCQLVLGGGATTTIGMKSITIKHLALTARSLQLVLRVLPSVRGAATSLLVESSSTSVSIRQLNKVEADVQTHIQEVWGKICAIMESFFHKHVDNYELKAPIPSAPMKTIVKQIKKLSDSLNEVLPPAEMVALLSRVHSIFTRAMDARLSQKMISQNDGLLLSEVSFYMSNIRKLPGMAGTEWS